MRVDYEVVELDTEPNGCAIGEILKRKTGKSSVPRVFIKGKYIGGGTEMRELYQNGRLEDLISNRRLTVT